jgi:hypothetical protein
MDDTTRQTAAGRLRHFTWSSDGFVAGTAAQHGPDGWVLARRCGRLGAVTEPSVQAS